MIRFLHSVEKVLFLDGADVRRAPMTAALFRRYIARDPVLSLWHIEVASAGSGKFTKDGASPVQKAKEAMLELGIDISSHRARSLTLPMIERASIVLGIEDKHVTYVHEQVCQWRPSFKSRIISFFEYLGAPDLKFCNLIRSEKLSDYQHFATWMESLLPRLSYRFQQDAYSPLLTKGTGLDSGVARGPARIVKSTLQAKNIWSGDIIVCETNDIVAVCGRERIEAAGAIVTDSASEVSQLSQFSHELAPCVAGTTCGTQVLYDGVRGLGGCYQRPGIRHTP